MSSSRPALLVTFLAACSTGHCGRATTSGADPAATGGAPRGVEAPKAAEVIPASASPVPTSLVRVPPKLADEGALELSGLAYEASIGRYLIVSDDTGRKEKKSSRHAPWLFAMSPAGEMDVEPISIAGLDEMNDPESITPGPGGTYFVCTSHSPNKKGRTPPERAMLIELAVSGRSARLLGRVDLRGGADGLVGGRTSPADGSEGLLSMAGLDPKGVLDIEGIAYIDGDLLVGLKSPLAADGSATLLRLPHVVDTIKKGRVESADVARYARLKLSVPTPGGQVGEGISDLLLLPDKSLLVLANAPKGMPPDGGGSAWRVAKPAEGTPDAVLLHRFPGLKPEGAALSPDGSSITIVFDRNQEAPVFAHIDVPR